MHQLARLAREDFGQTLFTRRQARITKFDARTGRLDGRDLGARRVPRNDDDGPHAARPRRQRQRIAVIARRNA